MNFDIISKIHNENFEKKQNAKFFSSIENVYNIYSIENCAYLILIDSIDVYEIFEIAVSKDNQRRGYATKLLEMLPTDKDIFLEVREDNFAAIKLYEKLKFFKIALRKNYYGEKNAIIMKKSLDKHK